jgi:DNA-binding response OmpR family regulator
MPRPFNILLVEDEPMVQFAMSEGLRDAGHSVIIAASVDEAFTALTQEHNFEVVLLDLRLGDQRGEEIFVRLVGRGVAYPPVIIVSAQPEFDIRRAVQRISAAGALLKPASIEQINVAMEATLKE